MCSLQTHSERSTREREAAKDTPIYEETGMARFQDALGDYYDSGAIGDPPRREDFQPHAR